MPVTAELHDGTRLEFPDGTDPAVVQRTVKGLLAGPSAPSGVQQAGSAIRDIPRQAGLFGRYALEAGGQMLNIGTEPIRHLIVNPLARLAGVKGADSTSSMASGLADTLGLPRPANEFERVIGDATRTGLSGMGIASTSRAAAGGLSGAAEAVATKLAARPGIQAVSGATAGAAGGAVREAGGGPWEQFWASLAGGVAGGAAAGTATNLGASAARKVASMTTPTPVQIQQVDNQIRLTLQRAGVDWGQVPERIRQGMRTEVAEAMNTGQPLNADALRRLLVMRQAGVTPTVGMLTQDPGQLTREMNLAKTGANSTDVSLQRLPALQNQNTAILLRNLDNAGAEGAPSAFQAGESAINRMRATEMGARANIDQLYAGARDTQGRSLPLQPSVFTGRANALLDEAMVGGALPKDVANTMNRIATGEIPLTVEIAEQLKTRIGNLQRATNDGGARMALGLVRQALDETPLVPSPGVNPGNLPAVPGAVPPSATSVGQESIDAFNAARAAYRTWRQRVEGNPALQAVEKGVEPDQFVQRFVLGNGATAADVRSLRNELDPGTMQAFKQLLVKHLRDAATNSTDDITKFSNASYRSALRDIGDEKLAVFFSREEIDQLRNLGEAAKYMQAQPAGSAINNSNSGALMLGRGMDMMSSIAGRIPFGLRDTIEGSVQGIQQRQVLNPRNALVQLVPRERGLAMNPLVAASIAPQAVNAREDERRR